MIAQQPPPDPDGDPVLSERQHNVHDCALWAWSSLVHRRQAEDVTIKFCVLYWPSRYAQLEQRLRTQWSELQPEMLRVYMSECAALMEVLGGELSALFAPPKECVDLLAIQ